MSNRRRLQLAATLSALALVVTACGSEDPKESASTPTTQETETTATVAQYASIVAKNEDLKTTLDDMGRCDWIGDGRLDSDPALIVCMAGLTTMSLQASTLATELNTASDPTAPGYIGQPPAELMSLVASTTEAAENLADTSGRASDANCGVKGTGKCSTLRADTFKAMGPMEREMAAWGPYL